MITKISNELIAKLAASSSYKERFIAEYILLKQKHEKLKAFNTKIEAAELTKGMDNGVDEPLHDCPASLLREQQKVMGEYLHILEVRAVIEGIDLRRAIEYLAEETIQRASECRTVDEGEGRPCCKSDSVPPCEEEIYREAAGLMSLKQTISMWESLVDAEREAGESTFLATNTLYHLKKYAEGLEPCHAIGENRDAKHK